MVMSPPGRPAEGVEEEHLVRARALFEERRPRRLLRVGVIMIVIEWRS